VGRTYEAVIRVNSQSGKGGIAYIMEVEHGMILPRRLQTEFSQAVQHVTEDTGTEIAPSEIWDVFRHQYLPEQGHIQLLSHEISTGGARTQLTAQLLIGDEHVTAKGEGNGPIEAFAQAVREALNVDVDVVDYSEHSIGAGADAQAVAYIETSDSRARTRWGVGIHPSILTAGFHAIVSALNGRRAIEEQADRTRAVPSVSSTR
jgi:2-isopropylmalate synthase